MSPDVGAIDELVIRVVDRELGPHSNLELSSLGLGEKGAKDGRNASEVKECSANSRLEMS